MNKLVNLTFDHELPKIRGDSRISALDLHFIDNFSNFAFFRRESLFLLNNLRLYFVFYYKNIIFFLTNTISRCYVEVF